MKAKIHHIVVLWLPTLQKISSTLLNQLGAPCTSKSFIVNHYYSGRSAFQSFVLDVMGET
jgi:hypothetical protein